MSKKIDNTLLSISRKSGELEAIDKSNKFIKENFGDAASADYLKYMEVYHE